MTSSTDTVHYTVDDAARRLGVSNRAILKWIHHGAFPNAFKLNPSLPNSHYRIPGPDITAFEASRHPQT